MVRAKKSLGQNFLVDAGFQRRIVDALELQPEEHVIEIGPGTGALTRHLAEESVRLTAVELDDGLAARLREQFARLDRVQIVHADALQVDFGTLVPDIDAAKIVGNIPYNITSPLIFKLLERPRPERIVLMIQKEVAERIVAPAGGKTYGALSVGVRTVSSVERLFHVPRGAFRPVPDVDSTVIRLKPRRPAPLDESEERDVRSLTRVAFAWRRKQLQKILRASPEYALSPAELEAVLSAAQIDPEARPETLEPDAFVHLARGLRSIGRSTSRRTDGGAAA